MLSKAEFYIIAIIMVQESSRGSDITRAEWDRRLQEAKRFMAERAQLSTKTLIEIAAQHPLIHGREPNEEFSNRLTLGIELFRLARKEGREVEVYVPGSRHMHEGIVDEISLSAAGRDFLLAHAIPSEAIHGDDLNQRYKGEDGVYNSADECFVAASYFKDGGFGNLLVIESPGQLQRKAMHYTWFGVYPLQYTAPTLNSFHDPVKEAFEDIPYVRDIDPSCQGNDSLYGNKTRRDRNPDL